MNKKNVVVWGASGTIGQAIAQAIIKRADFDLKPDLKDQGLRFGEPINRILSDTSVNVLIMACGPRDEDIDNIDSERYLKNVYSLLQQIPEDTHLFYISTARVYEGSPEQELNENSTTYPTSNYAKLHLSIEDLCFNMIKKCTVLRPQAVYNYDLQYPRRSNLIVNSFPHTLLNGENIILKSSGEATRNFVSSIDIASCAIEAIQNQIYGVLHPIGARTLSVRDYKGMVEALYQVIILKQKVEGYPYSISDSFKSKVGYNSIRLKQRGRDILTDTIRLFRGVHARL